MKREVPEHIKEGFIGLATDYLYLVYKMYAYYEAKEGGPSSINSMTLLAMREFKKATDIVLSNPEKYLEKFGV